MLSVELQTIEFTYRRLGEPETPGVLLLPLNDASSSVSAEDTYLRLEAQFQDGVLSVEVTSLSEEGILPESLKVVLAHPFSKEEELLLNGYQTWTDTVWRSPFARMRGLRGVPKALVKAYSLDALGDYRFYPYPNKPGIQHGYSYGCIRNAKGEHLLLASVDESKGFLCIETDAREGKIVLAPEVSGVPMKTGQKRCLLSVAIAQGNSEAEVFDAWASRAGLEPRPISPLVGYSSWYRHFGNLTEEIIGADLQGTQSAFELLETEGLDARVQRLFQVDDGWCKVGDWLLPDKEKFPHGMAVLAEKIRQAGFIPGLWLAPFVCEKNSRVFQEHPDWILRDEAGIPQASGSHWSGAYALDVLRPEVQDYVSTCLHTAVTEWGFSFLKLDFLYAACLLPRQGKTRGEIMALAMKLIREAVGEQCLINGCGVPLLSAAGVVDYCRIGCDVGLDWDDKLYMRLLHRERISTKNAVGNVVGRGSLNGRLFGNDPDVIFLRQDVKLTDAQKQQLLDAAAVGTSMLLTSDDMSAWPKQDRARYIASANKICERMGL